MGKLLLRQPDGTTREFTLERERLTIGRRADNDICLPYPAVSAEHAAVVTILDDSFLEDLHSTNGTLVNGKRVTKHFLRDRDEIDIGKHTIVYVTGEFTMPSQTPLDVSMAPVSVTANGGATIDVDESTLVPPSRERPASSSSTEAASDSALSVTASDPVVRDEAPAIAATLEVLDGPQAGTLVQIDRDDFVLGRPGMQIAVVRSTADGHRLMQIEGDAPAHINGAELPAEGALLSLGDEIDVAQTRLRYRRAL